MAKSYRCELLIATKKKRLKRRFFVYFLLPSPGGLLPRPPDGSPVLLGQLGLLGVLLMLPPTVVEVNYKGVADQATFPRIVCVSAFARRSH